MEKLRPPINSGGSGSLLSDRDETVRVEALSEIEAAIPDPEVALSLHRRVAEKLLADGSPARAFAELLRAIPGLPIDDAYVCELVRLGRKAAKEAELAAALESAVEAASPSRRPSLRRRAARLYRRLGKLAQAREHLEKALAEDPSDIRARRELIRTCVKERNFALAAGNLEIEAAETGGLGRYRAAFRASVSLARLLGEELGDRAGAARAWGAAGESASRALLLDSALCARALGAQALSAGGAEGEALAAAPSICSRSRGLPWA